MAYAAKTADKKPDLVRCHRCYGIVPVKEYLKHRQKCKKGACRMMKVCKDGWED